MTSDHYLPVNCGFHDRLLHFVTRREQVHVLLKTSESAFDARILDVFTAHGAEFATFDNGLTIRLDHLRDVNGFLPDGGGCAV
ncbi:MAG TPA: hypothetical protein VHS96_12005 [Bacteroidia bacterium]|nr:hypothetical protein [Bacteroidia bacterium]